MSNTGSMKSHLAHNTARPRIAITCGEPAGIGPEIAVRAALQTASFADCVLLGDAAQLQALAAQIAPQGAPLNILDCPLAEPAVPGRLNARNGAAVLQTLDRAIAAALVHEVDAVVTAPVQKSTINDAGIAFTGHTEYFAEKTGTAQVVMMLAGVTGNATLRVALATTHLALKDVPAAITRDSLALTLSILHHDLQTRFGIAQPRILVTGLNPHAGEGGYLGREEIDVITPVLQEAQAKGWQVSGPYPADTLFQSKYLQDADCVLAMYHDQGLPVLKHASFGRGVNITLGLPIIRTSVDHGTALDLAAAGLGHADCSSMVEAIRVACQMATHDGDQQR
jgi:4-hydroxythreonine-4-phosphate dehydrogenase